MIPDSDLREEVRQLILVELLPLYNKFYAHYRDIYFTKRQDKYLVYTDADLRNMVKDFFSKG